uniref:Hydin adenylate kinase-like domain-containing protein n=1 Tax=Electrophorus electricus TaxID=8005 RepID=A0A4W4HAH7_ELEEL
MRLELAPGQSAHMLLEGSCDVPKVVRERLVCHAIVGHQSGKERIMTVDVTCRFISPVLEISSQQLNFYVEKVPGMSLVPQYQSLHLKSVSALALSLELTVPEPFGLCECTGDDLFTITKCLVLGVGAETVVRVRFDPSYRPELESRVTEAVLEIRYCGHPQRDSVALRGEVHFPNLHFSSKAVDFGCVLNCTEAQRQLTMTNCSPLPVSYRWAFLLDQKHYNVAGSAGQAVGVLSVEAVARHTAEGVQATDRKAPASTVSTCNKTSITGPKNNNSSNPTATSMAGQVHRVPSESMSQNELAAMSSLLPDDLLVEILSERLQLSDCHRGVMIDSLETLFCRSPSAALQIILKAFNNRQHIYVIDLINNYYAFKRLREEEEMKKKNKKGKKEVPKDDSSGKRSQLGVKQVRAAASEKYTCYS